MNRYDEWRAASGFSFWFCVSFLLGMLLAWVTGCSDPLAPHERARILSVDARSCEVSRETQSSRRTCVQQSHEIDLADPPRGEFLFVSVRYQNVPEPAAWEVWSLWVEDDLTQSQSWLLDGTPDPATGVVLGDTVWLGLLAPSHPTVRLQITLAEGEDQRFVRPVADTSFTWLPLSDPPSPEEMALEIAR